MFVKLILIRHPETEANAKRLIYGRTESEYTEKGRASVATVVEQLSQVDIHMIYSSPLKRALDLAKAIAESHSSDSRKIEVNVDERLQEMHFGIFENKTNEQARELYGDGFDHFLHDFANFVVPEGESLSQVRDRAVDFLKELLASELPEEPFEEMVKRDPIKAIERWDEEGKTVVIVAHSLVIRGALSWLLNIPLNEMWRFEIKPASIVEVSYRGGYGFLSGLR